MTLKKSECTRENHVFYTVRRLCTPVCTGLPRAGGPDRGRCRAGQELSRSSASWFATVTVLAAHILLLTLSARDVFKEQ